MIKGESKTGFKFNINEKFIDWELLEMMAEVDKNPILMISIAKRLLGIKQYNRLKDHCRTKDGRMEEEIFSIIDSSKETIN